MRPPDPHREPPLTDHASPAAVASTAAIVASVVAHLVLAWGLSALSSALVVPPMAPMEFELISDSAELVETPPSPVPEPEPFEPVQPPPSPQLPPVAAVARPVTPTEAQPAVTVVEPVAPTEAQPSVVSTLVMPFEGPLAQTEEERRRAIAAQINPAAAARTMMIDDGPMPVASPDGTGSRTATEFGTVDRQERAQGMNNHFAELIAADSPNRPRPPPELRRTPDGGYAWSGPRFTANIGRDGVVHFSDQGPIQGQGFNASFSFDLTELAMQGAGQDPNRAEREWFMEHTEDQRQALFRAWRREVMTQSLTRLRGELRRIWNANGITAARKRRTMLEMWADCDDDADGVQAREIIEEFVRINLPQGQPGSYGEQELSRFNASRGADERFEPYAPQ